MTIKDIIANKLIEKRTGKELTQQQVADMIKVSRSAYSFYETGKKAPKIETLIKIADFYDISVDYLIGRYDKK